jgi:hypothetical protein
MIIKNKEIQKWTITGIAVYKIEAVLFKVVVRSKKKRKKKIV